MKILAWTVGIVIVLPLVAATSVMLGANTDWGRRFIEDATARLSGHRVIVTGLSGHFPDDVRLAHAELHDDHGAWLSVDDFALQWSPARLVHKQAKIEVLHAGRLQLERLPARSSQNEPARLPVQLDVDRVQVERMEIGAPIAGAAATVALEGDAHVASVQEAAANITVTRIDAPGIYRFNGQIDAAAINAALVVNEPPQGLLSRLAKLPDLGALSIQLDIRGPRNAETTQVSLAAGPLRASGHGVVDLTGRTIDLDIAANAPAMAPRPDLRWDAISAQAHVRGPFTRPDAAGHVHISELSAGGGYVGSVHADVQGNQGMVTLHAVLDALRLPGPQPGLLQSSPLDVRVEARLDDPLRPVKVDVSHPLISLQGHANTAGDINGAMTVNVASLGPFAAIAGLDVKGHAIANVNMTTRDHTTNLDLDGTLGITGGKAPLPELVGNAARVDASASLQGRDLTIKRAQVNGKTLIASLNGTSKDDRLDFNWRVALSNLSVLTAKAAGRIDAHGRLQGTREDLEVTADAAGEVASTGLPRGPIKISTHLRGLPATPSGRIEATGTLDGSPLQLVVSMDRSRDGAVRGSIQRAEWKSVHADGNVTLRSTDRLPHGRVTFRIEKLEDLRTWIGDDAQGSVTTTLTLPEAAARSQANLQVDARNVGMQGSQIEHATLSAVIDDPTTHPKVALKLAADGIAAKGITGNARIEATGPQEAVRLRMTSELHNVREADANFTSTATLNASRKQLAVDMLQLQYRGQHARLLGPVRVSFADGLAVDRARLGVEHGVLEIAGRISPTLDLTASLRNVTPDLAKPFVTDLQADGTLSMDARLTGTAEQPHGRIRMSANSVHARIGSARALPPANLVATADLNGRSARIDARLSAGPKVSMNASGQVPLSASGTIDVRANGTFDAAIANPLLEVNGRRANGRINADVDVRGTFAAPRIAGTLRVADADIQDDALGAHLTKVDALIEASGDTLRITRLTAHAGPGTLSATGTVGVFVPGRPIEVKLTGRNAQPLARDLLTANMDLDLTLRGAANTRLEAAGSIKVRHADINIPNALPPNVAVLDVRKAGEKTPPPAPAKTVIGLDLAVDAPRAVFVRGRGLDAEVGGQLHVGGTSASPQISGGLEMRRGTFALGGASLKFTSGKVSFTGSGVTQKIDPELDFEAESTANGITAKLNVTGYADAPKIMLTSTPELPQDEVLARLLFGVSVKDLSALQVAQIGAALASLGGVGGGGINPLMAVQKSLGLDRLSVGTAAGGGTSVEAGRYVSERVYVGAKQTISGGTQAQVQVDLTKHLKVQATLGTGGNAQGATPDNDPGSSIGLSYQFEY